MNGRTFGLLAALVAVGLAVGAAVLAVEWMSKKIPAPIKENDFWDLIHREEWLQYDGPHDE